MTLGQASSCLVQKKDSKFQEQKFSCSLKSLKIETVPWMSSQCQIEGLIQRSFKCNQNEQLVNTGISYEKILYSRSNQHDFFKKAKNRNLNIQKQQSIKKIAPGTPSHYLLKETQVFVHLLPKDCFYSSE